MILAAPLVIPFAEAVGISIATLGMAKAADMVNDYIQENPEESMKILSTIVPNIGIGQIFANKEDSGDDEEVEVEEDTRSKKEIVLEGVRRARAGKGNYSSPDATGSAVSGQGNVIRGLEDAGKIKKDPDPNYDPSKKYQGYKRFLKKADGGAIGIEVLFEEKKPRKNFNTGGTPYDARATTQDFTNALDKVGTGTDLQKAVAIGEYGQNARRQNPFKNLGFLNTQRHFDNNQLLKNAVTRGQLSSADYNRLGGFDVAQTMGAGNPVLGGIGNLIGSTAYNAVQSIRDGQPILEGIKDIGRNVQGGTGLISDDLKAQYESIINSSTPTPNASTDRPTMADVAGPAATGGGYAGDTKNVVSEDPLGLIQQINKLRNGQTPYANYSYQPEEGGYVAWNGTSYSVVNPEQIKRDIEAIQGLASGGRVGLFMGGDPLTGQALSIYDSMKAYNFSDQQIADALSAQGLYTAGGSTPDTPDTTIQPIGFQSGNGGGGGGITELDPLNRPKGTPFDLNSLTKTKFGYNNTLGRTIEGVKDFTGSMIDKFSDSKIGEGITSGATKFKNMAFTPMMALMQKRNPLNPNAMNYNPNLQKQMDFLEGTTGTRVFGTSDNLQFEDAAMIGRDPNSGLAKYGPGSVLSGQNVVSGFGTNDYEEQLANYVEKMRNRAITKTLTKFQQQKLDAAMAELGREKARQEKDAADRARAANADVYAELDKRTGGKGYGDAGGFSTSRAGKEGAFGTFGEGRGRKDFSEGGLATMFKEKR